jgi:hypothetical protein
MTKSINATKEVIMTCTLIAIVSLSSSSVLEMSNVHAQDNPFKVGSSASPFAPGSSTSSSSSSRTNTTIQILSNTDWSGSYGDSTGSTNIDGSGNRNITLQCADTYSGFFHKTNGGQGFITLNVIQNFSDYVIKRQDIEKNGVALPVGKSITLTKQITDLHNPLSFTIIKDSNSSSNATPMLFHSINTTLQMKIIDPKGVTIVSKNSIPDETEQFSAYPPDPKPDIAGKYTFILKNIGSSPFDAGITYGSATSYTKVVTQHLANTKTTNAKFGGVSVSGTC